jgi:hypothetical protein
MDQPEPDSRKHRDRKADQNLGPHGCHDAGDGIGGSVTLFESQEDAVAANEQALAWIRGSLIDVIDGEPEITMGEVLVAIAK